MHILTLTRTLVRSADQSQPPCHDSTKEACLVSSRQGRLHYVTAGAQPCVHGGGGGMGFWEAGALMPWPDVNVAHSWHLSLDRVPVPPVQASGRARQD
jgi:hypothetical protein